MILDSRTWKRGQAVAAQVGNVVRLQLNNYSNLVLRNTKIIHKCRPINRFAWGLKRTTPWHFKVYWRRVMNHLSLLTKLHLGGCMHYSIPLFRNTPISILCILYRSRRNKCTQTHKYTPESAAGRRGTAIGCSSSVEQQWGIADREPCSWGSALVQAQEVGAGPPQNTYKCRTVGGCRRPAMLRSLREFSSNHWHRSWTDWVCVWTGILVHDGHVL